MLSTSSTPAASTNILKTLQMDFGNRTIGAANVLWGETLTSQKAHTMLPVYTRHYPPCEKKNPVWRRCKCPK
jgi:hypothetical protein